MKTKIILISIFGLTVIAGLGLLMSCDEEKALNTSPTACLQITSFQQSGNLKSVNAGGSYTFTREIKNDGPSDAKDVTLGYYLSTDDKITTTDTPLNVEDKLDLPSGTNNAKNVDIKIPATAASGTKYYIGVLVTSSSCTNNCPDYKSYEISISNAPTADSSCLTIAEWHKSIRPQDNVVAGGESIDFTGTIRNDGPVQCSDIRINFYLSGDETITTSDTLIGSFENTLVIPVGGIESIYPTLHIPDNLERGDIYYIGMLIESSSCQNTCSSFAIYAIEYEPFPYLITRWTRSNFDVSIFRGDTVTFSREIKHSGSSTCTNVRIGYYLSSDDDITTADMFIGEEIINLRPNSTNIGTIDLQIPLEITGTCYYAGILIISSDCSSEQVPARSFRVCFRDSPLIGVINYGPGSVQPTDVTCGNIYTFHRSVRNLGPRTCDATLRYYFSTDCIFTTADTYMGVEETISIPAYSENAGTIDLLIPPGITPDMYHISYFITSTSCSDGKPAVGWDVEVTCPSASNPLGLMAPEKKLKATCR